MVTEDISVWVRDPRIQNTDFWHAYMDYEVCLLTNSLCFTKKLSCTRRRFSEFVWLRQRLQVHSLLITKLPEMPPKNPFFSLNNARQISERMEGLQRFLEQVLQSPLLLSDSCVHLFLQSRLSVAKMEACAAGRTRFSVAQAILSGGLGPPRFRSTEDLNKGSDPPPPQTVTVPEPSNTDVALNREEAAPLEEIGSIRKPSVYSLVLS